MISRGCAAHRRESCKISPEATHGTKKEKARIISSGPLFAQLGAVGYRNPFLTTVSVTVAVCVLPPPVPVIVMVWAPTVARVPTLTVIVDDPEPGAAMGFGLKVTVCWLPSPEADKVTAESKPFSAAVVIVEVPDLPVTTEIAVGDALMLKSAPAAAVTVRATVVFCVMPPPVPVIVIV